MAKRVLPFWVGYFLVNPLRRLMEDPYKMLGPFVREEMMVLEPGSGMGYFTLPLARMVGPTGRVVAVDMQPKMLATLRRRAQRAGLLDRIETRQCAKDGLGIEDLAASIDFAVAIHMVHEVPDQEVFFAEVRGALKPGGKLLLVEPKRHVSQEEFAETLATAKAAGFAEESLPVKVRGQAALLVKF